MSLLVCLKYQRFVNKETCDQCQSDPLFKQKLYLEWVRRGREGRIKALCSFRSVSAVGETTVECCGGQIKTVPTFHCSKYNIDVSKECFVCEFAPGVGPCPKDTP